MNEKLQRRLDQVNWGTRGVKPGTSDGATMGEEREGARGSK